MPKRDHSAPNRNKAVTAVGAVPLFMAGSLCRLRGNHKPTPQLRADVGKLNMASRGENQEERQAVGWAASVTASNVIKKAWLAARV